MAGAPLASYAANHQETYRDPHTGPPVPNAMGQKRKSSTPQIIFWCPWKQDYFLITVSVLWEFYKNQILFCILFSGASSSGRLLVFMMDQLRIENAKRITLYIIKLNCFCIIISKNNQITDPFFYTHHLAIHTPTVTMSRCAVSSYSWLPAPFYTSLPLAACLISTAMAEI